MCLSVPGQITSITVHDKIIRTGMVDFGGVQKEINLSYVPQAQVGDYVLVHVGFAISVIDEEDARLTLETLTELSEANGDHEIRE